MKINPSSTTKDSGIRNMSWLMLILFCLQILLPNYSYAGGPTQPEVSGFTPIGLSDMVDPFTGDFTYNIPLMDVEGYPINIAYNAGISMDQEASWVGLGWNLNVGSVVRNMRGLPDDFKGDEVVKTTSMKPNRTYSVDFKAGDIEIFGKTTKEAKDTTNFTTISVGMGIDFNNYNGWGINYSFGPAFNFNKSAGHKLTAGFSLSGSSENGASFAPSVSFENAISKKNDWQRSLTSNIGSSFNSRAGLSYISYGMGMQRSSAKDPYNENIGSHYLRTGAPGSYNTGLASYNPSAGPAMRNVSISGKWKLGPDFLGVDITLTLGISYASQWIASSDREIISPAYGYFNLQNGQLLPKALLDFNRDNDGSFTKETPNLPSAHLTYDLFSLNAQGISGSYRGFRNEVGYVFDPEVRTTSNSGDVGIETGMGALAKLGVDVSYNHTGSVTGGWDGMLNHAKNGFMFKDALLGFETFAMQEANERSMDPDLLYNTELGGSQPTAFKLGGYAKFASLKNELYNNNVSVKSSPANSRSQRYKRNQLMQFLSHGDLQNGFGINEIHPDIYNGAKLHHIGEIIQTGTDGRRYVFGIAAYNHLQTEVVFATGRKINNDPGLVSTNDYNGLIDYSSIPWSISTANDLGLDNYYSSTTTPAYAHSYLLTAVLSDDYSDSDEQKGPSENDLGTYVKFSHTKVDKYRWRTPMEANQAFRNEGMKTDPTDDKASFIYGTKDLWYTTAIETKNYIAIFEIENRADGFAVNDMNGGVDDSNPSMQLIRKISLYVRSEYVNNPSAIPIQEVHFVYSYELCPGYPGNPGTMTVPAPDQAGTGKLTLKEIYFTYQGSNRMKHSPYRFSYGGINPGYNMKAVDRWGNYKAITETGTEEPIGKGMNNADFPYTNQDQALTDAWVSAWSMTDIWLPSGGKIHVDYESDDYQYVQHKKAMRMFQIVSTEEKVSNPATDFNGYGVHSVSQASLPNRKIYFKLEPGHENINEYVTIGSQLYFRCLTEFMDELPDNSPLKYDYVSGYGLVDSAGIGVWNGQKLGWIQFQGQKLNDAGSSKYSPIAKAAIQFGRMHLSRHINDAAQNDPTDDNSEQGLLSFAQAAYNGLASFTELFTGPNLAIYNKDRGRRIVTNKSWVRLQEPDGTKLGGGIRVKRILMSDEWSAMTGNAMNTFSYGQEFSYQDIDGKSSGVASYEPQAGGDENPWRQPELYHNTVRFSPDQNLYQEEPIAESLFPSPTVGYARVVIRDLKREGVIRTATGKVVKEFYTARDFPTIVQKNNIEVKTASSFLPLLPKYQYVSASQGFSIELNDMHGKPWKESVYAENTKDLISTVEYIYQKQYHNAADNTYQLTNNVKVVHADGTISNSEVGVKREAVADFRKSRTTSIGGALEYNLNVFPVPIPPATGSAFTIWPSVNGSDNEFKSATLTKIINRFGILQQTIANQDGSRVETNNLAYDAETGEVLATQTTTNFNDNVYSFNYPAYWAYDQLGPAYKNIGLAIDLVQFNNSGFASIPHADQYFVEGDELQITNINIGTTAKGWVTFAGSTGIKVIDIEGNPMIGPPDAMIKVIRSGRRNKQMTSMASLTSLTDPLTAIGSNAYKNVLNAGAVEYSQDWKTFCKCANTGNPFLLGTKGNWRPVRSYTHLSGRTQSKYNNNTNIRRDGVFTSYTPYYRLGNGQWSKQAQNWTFVSEVTQFSPNGMTLETRDALGRYSASLFAFNNTLTTAVGANTSLKQLAFSSFEDQDYSGCKGQPFISGNVVSGESHTGRKSLLVQAGDPVEFVVSDLSCEDPGCTLYIRHIENRYYVKDGTAPYQMEVNVISGDVDVITLPSTGELQFYGNPSAGFTVEVTFTDARGCQYTETITKPAL